MLQEISKGLGVGRATRMLRNRSSAIYVCIFDAELMEVSTAVCMCCTLVCPACMYTWEL